MKAIILARVSTEEQKDAGNSLPAQIVRMEEYCKRKGFEIAETFSFDEGKWKWGQVPFRVFKHLAPRVGVSPSTKLTPSREFVCTARVLLF